MRRLDTPNPSRAHTRPSKKSLRRHRRALTLALGLAILMAVAVSDSGLGAPVAQRFDNQGFSGSPQTDIVLPETVRIEGT